MGRNEQAATQVITAKGETVANQGINLLAGGENNPLDWLWAIGTPALCTAVTFPFHPVLHHTNLAMIYLLGVCFVACHFSRGAAIAASLLSALAFDFFYIEPRYQFSLTDTEYLIAMAGMLLVALVISAMASRIRQQSAFALQRERRTAALYRLSRELAGTLGAGKLSQAAVRHISQIFGGKAIILVPDKDDKLVSATNDDEGSSDLPQPALTAAQKAFTTKSLVNLREPGSHPSNAMYIPLNASQRTVGVLALFPPGAIHDRLLEKDNYLFLETFANTTAVALERSGLAEEAARAWLQVETERAQNALLSSVSHDLRTPLAAIAGAASSLLAGTNNIEEKDKEELLQSIVNESERLNRRLRNLLNMTRLESGGVKAKKDWQSLEEVIGAALNQIEKRALNHEITARVPTDLPLVPFDDTLIEQVLINLLENALKYSPPGSTITVAAHASADQATVEVSNDGPSLAPGEETRVFEKFYRGESQERTTSGSGLGLTICRGIVEAHGGKIWAENTGSGPSFNFMLPIEGKSPAVDIEEQATV